MPWSGLPAPIIALHHPCQNPHQFHPVPLGQPEKLLNRRTPSGFLRIFDGQDACLPHLSEDLYLLNILGEGQAFPRGDLRVRLPKRATARVCPYFLRRYGDFCVILKNGKEVDDGFSKRYNGTEDYTGIGSKRTLIYERKVSQWLK
jgi:hypothetical protein